MSDFFQFIKTSDTDEWYTQEEDVEIIVPFLKNRGGRKILCPFDTQESNFVKVLTKHGFDVTYSHINTGTDFFTISNLKDYDMVVSNPPFSKRQKIFEVLFEASTPFALICNMNGLFDAKDRWELFRQNDFELIIPKGRMKFSNGENVKPSPNFQSIYVCSQICDKQIEFVSKE